MVLSNKQRLIWNRFKGKLKSNSFPKYVLKMIMIYNKKQIRKLKVQTNSFRIKRQQLMCLVRHWRLLLRIKGQLCWLMLRRIRKRRFRWLWLKRWLGMVEVIRLWILLDWRMMKQLLKLLKQRYRKLWRKWNHKVANRYNKRNRL